MDPNKHRILSSDKIFRILKRMAVEIYENNFTSPGVVLVGVYDQGYRIAAYIQGEITKIDADFQTTLIRLDIDKENPSGPIQLDQDVESLDGHCVILVDDVLNTSRTLAYSLKYLLQANPKIVETAVLINRSHAAFPILATYSGYELATALDEHIDVKLDGEIGAFLY